MEWLVLHTVCIMVLVALSATTTGFFLFLQGTTLLSDAISHALVLGVVIAFIFVEQLDSPWLFLGAVGAAFGTVLCTQLIMSTKRIADDAAIGLVFPLFFSCGLLLLSRYAGTVHLDTDMIMFGEVMVAPLHRFIVFGVDVGSISLWLFAVITILNVLILTMIHKALVFTLFDSRAAIVAGVRTTVLYYAIILLMSVTAVCTFNILGSSAFVALVIAPVTMSYLVSGSIAQMWVFSILFSLSSVFLGYAIALHYNVSVTGAVGLVIGFLVFLVLTFVTFDRY